LLHAPSHQKREKIVAYAAKGDGKSSTYINIACWMEDTKSDRKIWLMDSDKGWSGNRDSTGALDRFVHVMPVSRSDFDGWRAQVEGIRGRVHADDWFVLDLATHAWEGAQRSYWSKKRGSDSLADLWLSMKPEEVAGPHGTNWGIINKSYGEFMDSVTSLPCHLLLLADAEPVREPGKSGTGGDSAKVREFYEGVPMKVSGQKWLAGEGDTVLYLFRAGKEYRMTTVKERGPIGRVKREEVVNVNITDKGIVRGYLMPIAGWRL
jgi:hypothetical protein